MNILKRLKWLSRRVIYGHKTKCIPYQQLSRLIAYTNEYKIRDSIAKQFSILIGDCSIYSGVEYPYCICIGNRTRFTDYNKGRALEKLLNYYARREENYIYDNK